MSTANTQDFIVEFIENKTLSVDLIENEALAIDLIENTSLSVELIENEILPVDLLENKTLSVDLTQIDVINKLGFSSENLNKYLILNETPLQLDNTTFRTKNNYNSGSLKVEFNGICEKYINELSDNIFSFNIPIIAEDDIVVNYIKAN